MTEASWSNLYRGRPPANFSQSEETFTFSSDDVTARMLNYQKIYVARASARLKEATNE